MNKAVVVILCILGLLVVLLAVAAIRALFIKAKISDDKGAISYLPEEEKLYAERLSKMIQIPTVSLRGDNDLTEFERLHDAMREMFPLIHEKLERIEIDGNLIYRWKGADEKADGILLMGHQDVVPAKERNWEHEPFSGDIADGVIHGRGAMDCKCTVMAEFSAVEELLAEGFMPPCNVYLASAVNEEISGDGAPKTVKYLKNHGIRLSAVMDEGGAIMGGILPGMSRLCAAVGIVEKGYADIKITAKGSGGHSSTPPKNSPLARLADFVSEVEHKRPFKSKMTQPLTDMLIAIAPSMSYPMRLVLCNLWLFKPLLTVLMPVLSPMTAAVVQTTFAFTMCQGSSTPNVIPDEAYVICNIRPAIHQNTEESVAILKKIAAKHDLEVEVVEYRDASAVTDVRGAEFKYVIDCIGKCFPQAVPTPYYMTGGTDCRHYTEVSDNCLRFCPLRMNPQQLKAMHAANENIDTDALAESVKFYKYYIKNHK